MDWRRESELDGGSGGGEECGLVRESDRLERRDPRECGLAYARGWCGGESTSEMDEVAAV